MNAPSAGSCGPTRINNKIQTNPTPANAANRRCSPPARTAATTDALNAIT